MSGLGASEIVNVVVAVLFAVSEILPFIRNTEANGVIDFIRIFCVYIAIKLSRVFGVEHPAENQAEQNEGVGTVGDSRHPQEFSLEFPNV